jgi:hypothetical protein
LNPSRQRLMRATQGLLGITKQGAHQLAAQEASRLSLGGVYAAVSGTAWLPSSLVSGW